MPHSIRELLEVPQNTQAYTIGLQWVNPQPSGGQLRLQGELTYLEQTQFTANRPTQDYYTGQAATQGFTERGQVLGAAIGPGASSQFVGADWLAAIVPEGGESVSQLAPALALQLNEALPVLAMVTLWLP